MVSVAVVSQYVEGIDFPASKQDIVDYAEERNAPPDVMDILGSLPEPRDGWYANIRSVWDALSELE